MKLISRDLGTVAITTCAMFDLVVTGLFALQSVAPWFVQTLSWLNGVVGGSSAIPEFVTLHWFFVNLAGALGVLWALVRLLEPSHFLSIVDVVG